MSCTLRLPGTDVKSGEARCESASATFEWAHQLSQAAPTASQLHVQVLIQMTRLTILQWIQFWEDPTAAGVHVGVQIRAGVLAQSWQARLYGVFHK